MYCHALMLHSLIWTSIVHFHIVVLCYGKTLFYNEILAWKLSCIDHRNIQLLMAVCVCVCGPSKLAPCCIDAQVFFKTNKINRQLTVSTLHTGDDWI